MSNRVPAYRKSLIPALGARQEEASRQRDMKSGSACPVCASRDVSNIGRRGIHWLFFGVFALFASKRSRCNACGVEWTR